MARTMREINVAMAFLCQIDRYHFQLRTGPETIGAVGLIGCFGGRINSGETADEAVSREVAEETNISAMPDSFHFLGSVNVVSDRDQEDVAIRAKVFKILLPLQAHVVARQGALVTLHANELIPQIDKFTPATRAAIEELL